jgi:hypothetical protein
MIASWYERIPVEGSSIQCLGIKKNPWMVDSSYYVQTNVSVERTIFEALTHVAYIKGRYLFSLVCTFEKAIETFEVKVDVQKEPL